jgi:hypothetical protein
MAGQAFFLAFTQQLLVAQDAPGDDDDLMSTRDDLGGGAFDEEHFVATLRFSPLRSSSMLRPVIGWVVEGQGDTGIRPA